MKDSIKWVVIILVVIFSIVAGMFTYGRILNLFTCNGSYQHQISDLRETVQRQRVIIDSIDQAMTLQSEQYNRDTLRLQAIVLQKTIWYKNLQKKYHEEINSVDHITNDSILRYLSERYPAAH